MQLEDNESRLDSGLEACVTRVYSPERMIVGEPAYNVKAAPLITWVLAPKKR